MSTFALVNYHTREPVNRYAYTTAGSRREAYANFKAKRSKVDPKQAMFPEFQEKYETSVWDIIEVPPPPAVRATQMTFQDFFK